MTDDRITELQAAVERLTAERDLAREDCGHQRAMKESIRTELSVFIRLKMEADADATRLRGVVQAVKALRDEWSNDAEVSEWNPLAELCAALCAGGTDA